MDECRAIFASDGLTNFGSAEETFNKIHSELGGEIRVFGHGGIEEFQWVPPNSNKVAGDLLIEPNQVGSHLVYVVGTDSDYRGLGVNTMLLARAVSNRPNLISLEGTLKWVNREVYMNARKLGLSQYEAIKMTPFYKSSKAVGFSRIGSKSIIPENEKDSIILIMEKD